MTCADQSNTFPYAICLFALGLYAVKRTADYIATVGRSPEESLGHNAANTPTQEV